MIKRIIKILFMGLLFMGLLSLGGYTLNSFKSEVHLRDPKSVMSPLIQALPELPKGHDIIGSLPTYETENGGIVGGNNPTNPSDNQVADSSNGGNNIDLPDFTTDPGISDPGGPFSGGNNNNNTEITDPGSHIDGPSTEDPGISDPGNQTTPTGNDSYVDENGNIVKKDIKLPDTIEISYARSFKIKFDDTEIEVTSKNTAEFVRWLNNHWHADAEISYTVDKVEPTPTEGSESTETTGELTYDTTLSNTANLNALVNSINVIDALPEYDDYDRNTYEKPTQSYTLNGKKVNRNDYAWKTSPWYNAEDNTYMCPYTGTIIHDLDDKKEDNDFGNLDYDHIVPLKSAYLRGAKDWTEEQRNAYAYDQWVGVDVLNSANRSKSDKGPCDYLPDINVEDYCYSWLMICSKYNLSMTQEEIDLCMDYINIALENGEEVTFLGGSYEE